MRVKNYFLVGALLAASMSLSSLAAAAHLSPEESNRHQHSEQRHQHNAGQEHEHEHGNGNDNHSNAHQHESHRYHENHRHSENHQHHHCDPIQPFIKVIPQGQRASFKTFMHASHQTMCPLIKEKHALKAQLRGLLATPGVQWDDIAKVVEKMNVNHAKTTTLFARHQLDLVRKFGILLPPSPQPQTHVHPFSVF